MKKERQTIGEFIVIPYRILNDINISLFNAVLYGIICSLTNSKGYCWAGNDYLAKRCRNVTEQHISNSIRELARNGYISLEYRRDIENRQVEKRIIRPLVNFKEDLTNRNINRRLIKRIIDYLNEKTHCSFKIDTGTTIRDINGRVANGYTFKDFEYVIDIKCAEWKDTQFAKHLAPSTLFRPSNFEKYRNQRSKKSEVSDNRKFKLVETPLPNGKGSKVRKVYENELEYRELL